MHISTLKKSTNSTLLFIFIQFVRFARARAVLSGSQSEETIHLCSAWLADYYTIALKWLQIKIADKKVNHVTQIKEESSQITFGFPNYLKIT